MDFGISFPIFSMFNNSTFAQLGSDLIEYVLLSIQCRKRDACSQSDEIREFEGRVPQSVIWEDIDIEVFCKIGRGLSISNSIPITLAKLRRYRTFRNDLRFSFGEKTKCFHDCPEISKFP